MSIPWLPIGITVGLISLVLLVCWLTIHRKRELFQRVTCTYLTDKETKEFFVKDSDSYLDKLTQVNVHALGAADKDILLDKWIQSTIPFTPEEMGKLQAAAQLVNDNVAKYIKDEVFRDQVQSVKWKFAKTIHPYYLDGLPHTRGDVIFLTEKVIALADIPRLARLLMHEKAHIWERMFPEAMEKWMSKQGYQVVGKVSEFPQTRMNPDVDDFIYKDKLGLTMTVNFTSEYPAGLADVTFSGSGAKKEHPFEVFAYRMERYIKDDQPTTETLVIEEDD